MNQIRYYIYRLFKLKFILHLNWGFLTSKGLVNLSLFGDLPFFMLAELFPHF
jgi:hypothetical protein